MLTEVTNDPRITQLELGDGHRWLRDNGDCHIGQHSFIDCAYCHVVPFYTCYHDIPMGWKPDKINPKAVASCRKVPK